MNLEHVAKAVRLSDKMIERRDGVRVLLGDRYAKDVESAARTIRERMQRDDTELMPTTLKLATESQDDGQDLVAQVFVAAAVDIAEGKV